MKKTMNSDFAAKYPVTTTEYRNAVKLLDMEMVIGSLTSARVSLEYIVKEFCRKCGAETSDTNPEITLQDMINALSENGVVSEQEVSMMHRTRILCNKGAHAGAVPPELTDAQEAVELLSDILNFLAERDGSVDFGRKTMENNQPQLESDYYPPKRRYRGAWSECYTHEDLAVIPEYVQLMRRADEGDISAMLDLAIGFVHKNPVWSPNQLICMPKFYARGKEYYQDSAYDARYYYWILRACDQAICEVEQGGTYPKKYMANAFMDAMKFAISICAEELKFYVSGVEYGQNPAQDQLVYGNQYQLVQDLYGADINTLYENPFCWARELVKMVNSAGTGRIVSDLHYRENNLQSIRYLAYCFCCMKHYCDVPEVNQGGIGMKDCVLDHEMALCAEDVGAVVTLELLEKRTPATLRGAGYDQLIIAVCKAFRKETDKRRNHPKLAAMEDTGAQCGHKIREIAAKSPLAYRLLSNLCVVPLALACAITALAMENSVSVILLIPMMALLVLLFVAQSKLSAFFERVPVPEGKLNTWERAIYIIAEKAASVMVVVMLLIMAKSCAGIVAKVVIIAAAVLCICVNRTLRGICRKLIGLKTK